MRIRDIISEAISFTAWKHDIEEGLNEIGEMTILDAVNICQRKFGDPVTNGPPDYVIDRFRAGMTEFRVKELLLETDIIGTANVGIQTAYATLCSKLLGIPNLHILVTDQTVGAAGSADRRTFNRDGKYVSIENITFYIKDYKNFKEYDVEMLYDELIDLDAFKDDPHDPRRIVLNGNYEYAINQLFNVKLKEFAIFNEINTPEKINTMIHELVHVRQHMVQPNTSKDPETGEDKIKNTEFRSKVAPNPEKFRAAIRALYDKTQTPEDKKIYYSALQEIPAHAHSAALQIIREFDFNPEYRVDYLREQVQELIKATRTLTTGMKIDDRQINSWTLDYYSKTFNHPEDKKLYPVYKKFIKILHQELVNYIQYWVNKINEYESNKQGR